MIRNALLLIPLVAVLILYFLQEGISVNSLKVGNFKLQGLYLKLDNKLILNVKSLEIPKASKKADMNDVEDILLKVKKILNFFDYIKLDAIHFTNDTYRMIYADDTIYIDSHAYEIAGMIHPLHGGLRATIPLIYIKKYNLTLHGNLTYEYHTQKMTFSGEYKLLNIEGNLSAEMQNKEVKFLLNSKETENITKVLDMFPVPEKTRAWLDKKVKAKQYQLLTLRGKGEIVSKGFVLDIKHLNGRAILQGVRVKFHPSLPSVSIKQLMVRLHDDRLDFDLDEPVYQQKSITGTKVALLPMSVKGKKHLLLKVKFHSRYDHEIAKLLAAYKVHLPLEQKTGKIRTEVNLDIDLKKKKAKVEGRAYLSKGKMVLGGTLLSTNGGEVTFSSKQVALWNVDIYDSWYRGLVNGFINLTTKRAKLKIDLKRLTLGDTKSTSLQIKNKKSIPVTMTYKDGVQFDIPDYNTYINGTKGGGIKIANSDLRPLFPFIKGFPLQLKGGKITLLVHKEKGYDFQGEAEWKNSYLYQKGGYLSLLPFKGTYNKGKLFLSALNGQILYKSNKDLIQLKQINIDAKKMMGLYDSKGGKQLKKLKVVGKNSIIRYGKYVLLTDRFNLRISGRNTIFTATKDGDSVRIEKNGTSLVAHANMIKDTMLRALINFGGLQGGRYSLELLGDINSEMKGVIEIKGGAIESFKAYNDLIALFNTIPALMTLSDPGFSKKGFVVRDGKIVFRILQDRVIFDTIYLNGKSATVAGKGTVMLESGKLNIDLAIRTAREVGKVLGNLPIVGYILFGKDKSITTGVKITGTLEHPHAKTNPVQEALLYPLELIKRTVTSPAHIINQ